MIVVSIDDDDDDGCGWERRSPELDYAKSRVRAPLPQRTSLIWLCNSTYVLINLFTFAIAFFCQRDDG
jgi:hypothetical protein